MLSTHPAADLGVLPANRLSGLVVLSDVAHELAPKVLGGGEGSAIDEVALQLAEPELHLVEPGRISRREVQLHVGVFGTGTRINTPP